MAHHPHLLAETHMSMPRGVRRAQVDADAPDACARLADALGPGPFEILWLFASPEADFDALTDTAFTTFAAKDVIACSTAGEIGALGYEEGQIIAVALPQQDFTALAYPVGPLDRLDDQAEIDRLIRARISLDDHAPQMAHRFAFLLVDGLSQREDMLTASLASGLGDMELFGGSSGDGTRFEQTRLSLNGRHIEQGAVLSLVASRGRIEVFSLDHLHPTERKMVVTEADPARRIVRQINAEPAAQEYARIVGKSPDALDQFTFAAHPVVVQLGGKHHVRAIQRVSDDGALIFFSAIDEGMVLTLAESQNMARHLESQLAKLGTAQTILSCDCLLRRIEAEQTQQSQAISDILQRHNVVGFGTYGEQLGALHVNHTMTGVVFYAPDEGAGGQ